MPRLPAAISGWSPLKWPGLTPGHRYESASPLLAVLGEYPILSGCVPTIVDCSDDTHNMHGKAGKSALDIKSSDRN